ncbi:MAG: sensor histidine kinase [Actinomycetota bacterium]
MATFGGIGGVALFSSHDYQTTVRDARDDLQEVTRLMAEHTRAVMVIASLKLDHLADLMAGRAPSALRGSAADQARLRQMLARVPFGHSIWIMDADGNVVLTTVQPDPPAGNFADREYFQALKAGGPDTFVSPLIWGRLTGGHLLSVVRRLTDAQGRFQGIAVLSIRANYFLDFYRTVSPDGRAPFGIYKADGSVVVEYPLPPREVPRLPTDRPPFSQVGDATFGTYTGEDGERLVGWRAISEHGLIVTAGLSMDQLLADWRRRTVTLAAGLAVALMVVGWLVVLALAGLKREEAALAQTARKADELALALADKDVLFQEVHHRVKNNLQVVSSILTMQSLQVSDEAVHRVLQQALDRVHAMGLVHQTLYLRNEASAVDIGTYLQSLAASLSLTYDADGRGIAIVVDAQGMVDLERAVPLGLLSSELLSNALKHAFPGGRTGSIRVELERGDAGWRLAVEDDGIGLPEVPSGGIGLVLARGLARQLQGSVEMSLGPAGGTLAVVRFPA